VFGARRSHTTRDGANLASSARRSEPVPEAGWPALRMRVQKGAERLDHAADRASVTARELPGVDEDDAEVSPPRLLVGGDDPSEVAYVLGHERAPLPLCHLEEVQVRKRAKLRPLHHGNHVVPAKRSCSAIAAGYISSIRSLKRWLPAPSPRPPARAQPRRGCARFAHRSPPESRRSSGSRYRPGPA